MAKPPRTAISGTFFITAITANRRRLFQAEANAKLFLETLQHYRAQDLYKLHAFVAMPDHIHLLLTTADLPHTMKHIRGGFSRRLASNSKSGSADTPITSSRPVPNLKVAEPTSIKIPSALACPPSPDYPYSSAYHPKVQKNPTQTNP
jgi:putative transposase